MRRRVPGDVAKTARGAEVPATMEAGTESVEWVREEFCGVDLADERLNRRLIKTAELLGKSPASPINEALWRLGEHAGGISSV